jgi:hypothetical protein
MDDARYGQRDKRGHWKPFKLVHYPPVFVWPAQPLGILKWLFGYPSYLLPWNLLYAAIAAAVWLYLTPATETLRTLAPGWIAFVLAQPGSDRAVLRRFPPAALHPAQPGRHVQVPSEMAGHGQSHLSPA